MRLRIKYFENNVRCDFSVLNIFTEYCKMKNFYSFIAIILEISDVIAIDDNIPWGDNGLACCPRSQFVLTDDDLSCFDPVNKTKTPNRIGCATSYGMYNFTVKPGIIEYSQGGRQAKTIDGSQACHGEMDWPGYNSQSNYTQVLLMCDKELIDRFNIYWYSIAITVIFVSATAVIYAIFGELRDLFGMSITNSCGSLAIGMAQIIIWTNDDFCSIRAFSVYFFSMASYFWTNAISIQIFRDTRCPPKTERGWKEFRWYCLYSWGVPTILTTIIAIVELHPGDHKKPGFVEYCRFLDAEQIWYYMNSIIFTLLVINLAIFAYVATIMWRFTSKSTYCKTLRFKLSMTIRLVLVMGLPSLIKILGRALGNGSLFEWFVLELMTAVQGILIFLVLVVRKKVMRVLQQRGLLACCSPPVERWLAKDDEYCDIQPAEDPQTNKK